MNANRNLRSSRNWPNRDRVAANEAYRAAAFSRRVRSSAPGTSERHSGGWESWYAVGEMPGRRQGARGCYSAVAADTAGASCCKGRPSAEAALVSGNAVTLPSCLHP